MFNLITVFNIVCNGLFDTFLEILAVLSILFGISVINSKNPIVSVLFLIGLFISISLNLILLGYNFIGLAYLLVYVGAVSILFLFILMLINVRISELLNDTSNSMPLALFTGISLGFPLYHILNQTDSIKDKYKNLNLSSWFNPENIQIEPWLLDKISDTEFSNLGSDQLETTSLENGVALTTRHINDDLNIYYVTSPDWEGYLVDYSDITSVGNILYSTYGIWLIICSIILLLAMVGAITITKKENN